MPTDLKLYRVFIASPGGLQDERKAFRDQLREYSDAEAKPRGMLFDPVGWEDTLGAVGRPQSFINEDVRASDFLVLLLWDRWGSPTGKDSSGFSSGTEEEYSVALECYRDATAPMKQIVLMFKGVDARQINDPGTELQKVLEFKERIERDKTHLFHTFETILGSEFGL